MKRFLLITTAVAAFMAWGAIVNAGPGNIRNTVHNMSSFTPVVMERHWYSNETDQVCIFCHTPHNAQPAQPLWNKVNPNHTFRMYTSSTTLTNVAKGVTAPGPESLLCLSCHDGRTAINVLHNSSVGESTVDGDKTVEIGGMYDTADPEAPAGFVGVALNLSDVFIGKPYGANLGKDSSDRYAGNNLMDDHPISFSYTAAYDEKVSNGYDALKPIESIDSRIRFFGPSKRMECSTCHDPHIDYGKDYSGTETSSGGNTALDPFLVRDNTGSALCLACHNK